MPDLFRTERLDGSSWTFCRRCLVSGRFKQPLNLALPFERRGRHYHRVILAKSNINSLAGAEHRFGRSRRSIRLNGLLICLLLGVVTLGLFWQVHTHDFINYDDPYYVTTNSRVLAGLSWSGVVWAFHAVVLNNWHPLTLLSHMLDCQLYGRDPAGHHLTSVFFHVANTLLLFLVLRKMTGAVWRSALVAALFAWHPLRVESVAWVSERKDVLSTFFWLLMLWPYARYVETKSSKPKVPKSRDTGNVGRSTFTYYLALLFFALGLSAARGSRSPNCRPT